MASTFPLFIKHLGGHPDIKPDQNVEINILNDIILLRFFENFKTKKIEISKNSILNLQFQEETKRQAGKIAAGAIAGGLITGGIGLIAGAALGSKKKNISTSVITMLYNDKPIDVYFETGKYTYFLYNEINKLKLKI